MFNKEEIKALRRDVDRLNEEVYTMGIKTDIKNTIKLQNRLERKLDMLMNYLGVEEKHEPEKHYIDRSDNE